LKQESDRLKQEIKRLRKELEAALRASKRQAAPHSRGELKPNPKPLGRKAGRAYGPRACRPLPPRVDEGFHVPLPARCPRCGGGVEVAHTAPQYQEEIVRRTMVRRFDIAVGRCRRCGRRVQGRHPLQWLRVAVSAELTVYAIRPGRGYDQSREILGADSSHQHIYVYPLVRDARQRLCGELEW